MPKSNQFNEVLHDAPVSHKPPMSVSERKRKQRERDRSRGQVEITVKVPLDRIEEIRQIAASMRKRKKRSDAGTPKKNVSSQMDWVDNA